MSVAPVFSGLPGETSHHISSSPSCSIAASEMRRCARCAGLNDPPRSPVRIKSGSARCRAQSICTSSAPRARPDPARGGAPWRCRFPRQGRTRRHRRTGSRHCGGRSRESTRARKRSAMAASLVTIASVWPEPCLAMCASAASRPSTIATARSASRNSVSQSLSLAGADARIERLCRRIAAQYRTRVQQRRDKRLGLTDRPGRSAAFPAPRRPPSGAAWH